jgi:hypothetical protein
VGLNPDVMTFNEERIGAGNLLNDVFGYMTGESSCRMIERCERCGFQLAMRMTDSELVQNEREMEF